MPKTIAIIGAGAAGLMAAAAIKETNVQADVLVFEKNAGAGAKIMLSGGGRCNLTNVISDVKKLIQNYPRGGKFLMGAFYRFPPEKVMQWFESHDVPVKTEAGGRVFPKSDNGESVVNAFIKLFRETGVKIHFKSDVQKISKKGETFVVLLKDGKSFPVDSVIITTGGAAYKNTGSTGDGYTFAQNFGHNITELAPSLLALRMADDWLHDVAGISFENVHLKITNPQTKKLYERTGAFLFTHTGITGPAVFALSSMAAYEKFDRENPLKLEIDFFPDKSAKELDEYVHNLTHANGKKCVINFVDIFLPKSLCGIFMEKCGVNGGITVGQLTHEQRLIIVTTLKRFICLVTGYSNGDEFVTAGGVDTAEVSSSTMESKLVPGLYFAGEVLNVDGFTGGFNLQAAWATGRLAGESAVKED